MFWFFLADSFSLLHSFTFIFDAYLNLVVYYVKLNCCGFMFSVVDVIFLNLNGFTRLKKNILLFILELSSPLIFMSIKIHFSFPYEFQHWLLKKPQNSTSSHPPSFQKCIPSNNKTLYDIEINFFRFHLNSLFKS